jgi:hypothetical protein
MAMLRALPCYIYGNFVLSLMREKTLTRADVKSAFQVKQIKRNAQDSPLVGSATLRMFNKLSLPRGDSDKCPFWTIQGHAVKHKL